MDLRLSYSAISTYEKCPLSYRYQYVDRIEVKPSPYLSFGRSLHAALEWLYGRQVPEPPPLEELHTYLDTCWDGEGFEGPEEEKIFLNHAHEVLERFYERNMPHFRLPVAVEERFEMTMNGYIISGVIDRVDRHSDGSYEIIDYKTNRRMPKLDQLREDLQLPIYQLACREVWGISASKLTFYYLITNQRYSTKPHNPESMSRILQKLDNIASRIRSGDFPATPNQLCPWCSYVDICPEKAHGERLEDRYISRYTALLRRRQGLERMIAELENEMRELGISLYEVKEILSIKGDESAR